MKRILLAISFVAAGCLSVPVRPPALNINTGGGKWEYREELFCGQTNVETLNSLGRDGWELVAVIATTQGTEQCSTYTFKRRPR